MAAVTFFLVASVFAQVLVVGSQLTILHSYPEPGNFSYVELVCVATGSSQLVNDSIQFVNDSSQSSSVVSEARFQLNGTDIGEDDENLENGTIRLLLTQEMEGFFTCSLNGSVSNTLVGLAGKFSHTHWSIFNLFTQLSQLSAIFLTQSYMKWSYQTLPVQSLLYWNVTSRQEH